MAKVGKIIAIIVLLIITGLYYRGYGKSSRTEHLLQKQNQSLQRELTNANKAILELEEKLKSSESERLEKLRQENNILRNRLNSLSEKQMLAPNNKNIKNVLQVATGPEKGYYFQLGRFLQGIESPSLKFAIMESPGSTQNLIFISSYKADIGFTQFDSMLHFRESTATKNLLRSIAIVAPIIEERIHIVVHKNCKFLQKNNVVHLQDFQGKKVNIGPVGSGTRISATQLLKIANIDVHSLKAENFSNALEKVANEELDILFVVVAIPGPFFENLPNRIASNIQLCSLSQELLDTIKKKYQQQYTVSTIPAKTYPWQNYQVNTLSTTCFLIARKRTPRNAITEILDTIFSQQELANSTWKFLTLANLEKSFYQNRSFYHMGVKKFIEGKRGKDGQ